MPPKDFESIQCGVCSLNQSNMPSIYVDEEDVQRWKKAEREDILAWVDSIKVRGGEYVHTIWVDPATKIDVEQCPWMKRLPDKNRWICQIYDLKPSRCREYPKSYTQESDSECKGPGTE